MRPFLLRIPVSRQVPMMKAIGNGIPSRRGNPIPDPTSNPAIIWTLSFYIPDFHEVSWKNNNPWQPTSHPMKENTRWWLIAAIGLVLLSVVVYTIHFLLFHDEHHLFIFLVGDLAFVPLEVLIVTLIIDRMLHSHEKQQKMDKLNMLIGMFYSKIGSGLLASFTKADPTLESFISNPIGQGTGQAGRALMDLMARLESSHRTIDEDRINKEVLRDTLISHEDFLVRLVENPMVFEHESFTDILLAVNHLTEELIAREDLSALPAADRKHLTVDKLRSLMKDVDGCEIERYELANLYAVNFYIRGILGDGVAASLRSDPQAKTLGEYFRAKKDMLPESILIENA